MNLVDLIIKIIRGAKVRIINNLIQKPRILKYQILSQCGNVIGKPKRYQPVLINGKGQVTFGENVKIGFQLSPNFFSNYAYIESRTKNSAIKINNNVWINNNFVAIAEIGIEIGENTLIGENVKIYDSDFHNIHPNKRINHIALKGKIHIGKNVFIGTNVTILKDINIGENSIIAAGSVVTRSIPENVIAGGIPARIIKKL